MGENGSTSSARGYAFGPFLVDVVKRVLWRDREVVSLTAKSFDLLTVLLVSHERIATKDELLQRVWPDTVVLENTLVRHMSSLRHALGQRADAHDYIVTIPGQGYRFVADVQDLTELPPGLPLVAGGRGAAAPTATEPIAPAGRIFVEAMRTPDPPAVRESPAPPEHARSWETLYVATLAIIGVLLVAGALMDSRAASPEPAPQRAVRQFTFDAGLPREPSWSSDGRWIAYTSDRSGNADIWIQSLTDPNPIRVTSSSARDSQPAWSPDGEWLALRSERDGGGVYVVSARGGGSERRVAPFGYQPRWSPDGSLILFSSTSLRPGAPRLYVVRPQGGVPEAVLGNLPAFRSLNAAWHPDGRRISVWGQDASARWSFLTLSVDGKTSIQSELSTGVSQRMTSLGVTLGRFAWARSGRQLYFEGLSQGVRNLWRITIDPDTLEWTSGPDRLTTGAGSDRDIALAPDGAKLAFTVQTERTRVWAFPFDAAAGTISSAGEAITSGGAEELDADASPDGSKLVYRAVRGGRHELWQRTLGDGQERLLVASNDWTHTSPRWSPDGTYLAYLRRREGQDRQRIEPAVAILSATDGNERLLPAPGWLSFIPKDWSADRTSILGSCQASATDRVGTCLMRVSGVSPSEPQLRVVAADPTQNLYCQRFSPDQRWISFVAIDQTVSDASRIYVAPVSGGPWTAITDGRSFDDKPRWAPDGRTLYFVSSRNGFLNVWGRRFDTASGKPVGDPFRVTSFESPRQMLSPQLRRMEIAVAANRLFLPVTERLGAIWILEQVDR